MVIFSYTRLYLVFLGYNIRLWVVIHGLYMVICG